MVNLLGSKTILIHTENSFNAEDRGRLAEKISYCEVHFVFISPIFSVSSETKYKI